MSAHIHEVVCCKQVDASFETVPESADEVFVFTGHELHHEQEVDVCADRVKEAPKEDYSRQEVDIRGEHDAQVEAQAEAIVVSYEPFAAINVAKARHPEQGRAPAEEEHGRDEADLRFGPAHQVELVVPILERVVVLPVYLPGADAPVFGADVCTCADLVVSGLRSNKLALVFGLLGQVA